MGDYLSYPLKSFEEITCPYSHKTHPTLFVQNSFCKATPLIIRLGVLPRLLLPVPCWEVL